MNDCYVADKHRPTVQANRGQIGHRLSWSTLAADTTIGCDRCSRPITGTVVAVTSAHRATVPAPSAERVHVACVTAAELDERDGSRMPNLTAAERRKLAGIKSSPELPKRGSAPKPWLKALDAAVRSPRFRLDSVTLADLPMLGPVATDRERALALAGAIGGDR